MVEQLEFARRLVINLSKNPNVNVISDEITSHPFDERNIHPEIRKVSLELFDDGHFSQATFEACKYLDKRVRKESGVSQIGEKLMMAAFNPDNPQILLSALANDSDKDIQRGYRFLFSGSVSAIRNPRGHEVNLPDSIDKCLDHLSFVSMLLRKLDEAVGPVV